MVLAAVLCGGAAGWLTTLGDLPALAALLSAQAAVLGALLFGLLRARDAAERSRPANSPLRVPAMWLVGLLLFCGAAYAAAFWLAGPAPGASGPRPGDYPALTDLLDLDQATPDELALLYQVRWSLMAQEVPVSEMTAFFQGVVGGLRRTHADERVLALRHMLINMDARAAERLDQPALPSETELYVPRGFLPPPAGSCGGTCGASHRARPGGRVIVPSPPPVPVAAPAPGEGCGGGKSCG